MPLMGWEMHSSKRIFVISSNILLPFALLLMESHALLKSSVDVQLMSLP